MRDTQAPAPELEADGRIAVQKVLVHHLSREPKEEQLGPADCIYFDSYVLGVANVDLVL